jgi:hypothetical protein
MKSLFLIFITILVYTNQILPQGWECEECPKRDLAFFEFDIWQKTAPPPGSGLDQADWLKMLMVADGVLIGLLREDPSRECINFYDGQMVLINEFDEENYIVGSTSSGYWRLDRDMSSVLEYLVSGSITKGNSDGVYIIKAFVETNETAERVVEASATYDFSISGAQNGKYLAQQLMPLMQHIRDFEKRKRDEDPEIIISAKGKRSINELKLEKEKLKAGETTDIEIEIIDCDGVPTKDMDVKLIGESGSFHPEKVRTDDNGKAVSKFTAGCDPGKYKIWMEYWARYPYSIEKADFNDNSNVKVEVEASDKFNIVYNHTMKHEYMGQFLLESIGTGTIPCTINWDAEPPTVKGEGTVKAVWSGGAEECIFDGNSNYQVNYKGNVVYSKDGSAKIQLIKTSDSDLGGYFKFICGTITQDVPANLPFPVLEEHRTLEFNFKDGETTNLDVPGSGVTQYSYTLKLNCK